MNGYNPDKWIVVHITGKDIQPIDKIFASWYDSWRLNSGIAKVSIEDSIFCFEGISGSVYECNKDSYGCSNYGDGIFFEMCATAELQGVEMEILPEETNWLEINYAN